MYNCNVIIIERKLRMNNYFTKKKNRTCLFQRCLAFTISSAIAVPPLIFEEVNNQQNTVCAATSSSYGDVNTDGKINIVDMIKMKSYLIENNSKDFSTETADVDGDGSVSSDDADELSMYLTSQLPVFSYVLKTDTDNDGICDYIEKEVLKSNSKKSDTDDDGLTDYEEVY